MNTLFLNSTSARMGTLVSRIIRRAGSGSALGLAGGALFGLVFGGFGILFWASWKIIPTAGYFALCGAAAGALLGIFGELLESDDDFEGAKTGHTAAKSDSRRLASVSRPEVCDREERQNRLAAFTNLDRRRAEIGAARNPSRN